MNRNRKLIRLTESQLNRVVIESVERCLNEGMYGYPDTVDSIILMFENDKDCMDSYTSMARLLAKKARKGVELSVDKLANCSWMKKFQQMCFRKFASEQEDLNHTTSPYIFRKYVAERMAEDVVNGNFD